MYIEKGTNQNESLENTHTHTHTFYIKIGLGTQEHINHSAFSI